MSTILTNASVEAAGYTVYYKNSDAEGSPQFITVGTVEANEDFALTITPSIQEITASQFGDETPVDSIYKGGNCQLNLILNEVNAAGALLLANAHNSEVHKPGHVGPSGALASAIGGEIKLAPYYTNLPVYSDGASVTIIHAPCCFIRNGAEIKRLLSAGLHTIPLSLRIFPFIDDADSNILKWWRYTNTLN